jgi:hypothetical protein
MATPRKAAAPKATAPAKPRAPKAGPKIIRNITGVPVHFRLGNQKDPFRVQLAPRGQQGDTEAIPVALQQDYSFIKGNGQLFEIITETEARSLEYSPVGYLGRVDAPKVYRQEDTTIQTADNWDGQGRRAPEDRNIRTTGQKLSDVPGSDVALHDTIRGGQADVESNPAMPDGVVFDRNVTVERVSGS